MSKRAFGAWEVRWLWQASETLSNGCFSGRIFTSSLDSYVCCFDQLSLHQSPIRHHFGNNPSLNLLLNPSFDQLELCSRNLINNQNSWLQELLYKATFTPPPNVYGIFLIGPVCLRWPLVHQEVLNRSEGNLNAHFTKKTKKTMKKRWGKQPLC